MSIRNQLDELLARDMDRKDFLAHMGAAVLTLVGISSFIRALDDPHQKRRQTRADSGGYGGGGYGARSEKTSRNSRGLL